MTKKSNIIYIQYFLILSLWCFLPFHNTYSQSIKEKDIYDRTGIFLDSLISWTAHNERSGVTKNEISEEDLFNTLANYPYNIEEQPNAERQLEIILPEYHNILSTNLIFHIYKTENENSFKLSWVKPPDIDEQTINRLFEGIDIDSTVRKLCNNIIDRRIHIYRTISFPESFRPKTKVSTLNICIILHGRDTDTLRINLSSIYYNLLYRLCKQLWVYAMPYSMSCNSSSLNVGFILLITTKDADESHFVTIEEKYDVNLLSEASPATILVHIYPYIRTDNLSELYGKVKTHPDSNPMPLHFNEVNKKKKDDDKE